METTRITIRVPIIIKQKIGELLKEEFRGGRIRSMNSLIVDALHQYLKLDRNK